MIILSRLVNLDIGDIGKVHVVDVLLEFNVFDSHLYDFQTIPDNFAQMTILSVLVLMLGSLTRSMLWMC